MKPLDKKQIPQVVALAIAALAFFGYFAAKLILPTPAAAGSRPAAAPVTAAPAAKTPSPATTTSGPAGVVAEAPPPGPGMRDPFLQTVSDKPAPPPAPAPAAKPVRTASIKGLETAPLTVPSAPPLPSVSVRETPPPFGGAPALPRGIAPLPVPLTPPSWTVTGVLQSGGEHVAILRDGSARRFVKQGDSVDGEYAVAAVTRDAVVLRHGSRRFTLPLGGAKAAPSPPSEAKTFPASEQSADTPTPAPDFTLQTLSGKSVTLSSLRGRVVVLDFWASWCGWCRKGMPQVQALHSRFASQRVAVLSINSWDQRTSMQAFLQSNPQYTTTMLFDPAPEAQSVAGRLYGVRGIPYTVVVDQQGQIAATFGGYSPDGGQKLQSVLARLGVLPTAPDIARLPNVGVLRRLASLKAAAPAARREAVCPQATVRVADYLSDEAPDVFGHAGPRGLLLAGTEAPDFSLSARDGKTLSLSQFRGGPVVLHFWASWDAASRQSFEAVTQLRNEFAGQGLTVLSVNSWDNRAAWAGCVGIGDPQSSLALFDPSVSNASVAVSLYHVPDVPAFYVVDAEGRVAGAFVGYGHNTVARIKATLAKLGVE